MGILLWLNAAVVYAAESANAWQAEAELGYVSTSGNTDTKTINAKAKVQLEKYRWKHTASVSVLDASEGNHTTAERYDAKGKSAFSTDEKNYFFVSVDYADDRFSGYQYQVSEAIGYGRRLIAKDDMKLDLELGPGARQSELEDGSHESETIARGGLAFLWKWSTTSKFDEEITVDAGENTTVTNSVTSISAQIVGNLAMKLSYSVKNTTDVPPGIKDTDTQTAVTLVYTF